MPADAGTVAPGAVDGPRHFDALGFAFSVRAPGRLASYLDDLLGALARPGPADHHYEFLAVGPGVDRAYELRLDGSFILGGHPAERLVGTLIHDVNRQALDGCELLAIHAGGVECDGVGVVLPGRTAAGKSTLVAGLVRAGCRYLTDEAVALERDTLAVRPYPKPLVLDPGAWPLFAELEPHADLPTDGYKAAHWYVSPEAIRPGSVGQPCPIGLMIFPRYEIGAEPALVPMGRAEALVELATNTFRFGDRARETLDLLAETVRSATGYRLTTGTLDRAVGLVVDLVGGSVGGADRQPSARHPRPSRRADTYRQRIDERAVPRRSSGVHTVELDGEAVLLDERTGRLHLLNHTATLVWTCFDGVSTVGEIVSDLGESLGVPYHQALADSLAVLRDLGRQGLLDDAEALMAHAPSPLMAGKPEVLRDRLDGRAGAP